MNGFGLDVPYTHATTGQSYVAHMDSSQKVCGNPMGLQEMLKDLGFYAGPVDGKLGPAMTNAMAAFANAASVFWSPTLYPTGELCQAIMEVWAADQGKPTPPKFKMPSGPAAGPEFESKGIPFWPGGKPPPRSPPKKSPPPPGKVIRLPSGMVVRRTVTPTGKAIDILVGGAETAPVVAPAPAGWWEQQSTGMKVAVVGGGLAVVGGLLWVYVLAPKKKSYAANRHQRRRKS